MKTISISRLLLVALLVASFSWAQGEPPVRKVRVGERVQADDGSITLTCIGKKQNYSWSDTATRDVDVMSPKSVNFHPDGTKYYVNSLEGCRTVVYDMATGRKLKVIHHDFKSGQGELWNAPSNYYRFTHYVGGEKRAFLGKPVESTFSHGGRYLWVPYYRRTFDINAQDPSAVAIIDTQSDSIVRMMETGPLPKMIACSHDNKLVAITHWGNNTVGLVDISSPDIKQWHHLAPVVVEHELTLNFSLTHPVNRDANSGLLLRGTVFTPDDRYLLVGCMGGGGIAVIDVPSRTYLGILTGISNARHLIINHGYLYASVNAAGLVQRIPLDAVIGAIEHRSGTRMPLTGWQTCHVGGGARTIEASPSGRYVFAACNSASALYVVDTRTMRTVTQITVDSYPVGLHIADDGRFLVVTSQARSGLGGNAVNLYRVDYRDSIAERAAADSLALKRQDNKDSQATNATAAPAQQQNGDNGGWQLPSWANENNLLWLILIAAAIILTVTLLRLRHNRTE